MKESNFFKKILKTAAVASVGIIPSKNIDAQNTQKLSNEINPKTEYSFENSKDTSQLNVNSTVLGASLNNKKVDYKDNQLKTTKDKIYDELSVLEKNNKEYYKSSMFKERAKKIGLDSVSPETGIPKVFIKPTEGVTFSTGYEYKPAEVAPKPIEFGKGITNTGEEISGLMFEENQPVIIDHSLSPKYKDVNQNEYQQFDQKFYEYVDLKRDGVLSHEYGHYLMDLNPELAKANEKFVAQYAMYIDKDFNDIGYYYGKHFNDSNEIIADIYGLREMSKNLKIYDYKVENISIEMWNNILSDPRLKNDFLIKRLNDRRLAYSPPDTMTDDLYKNLTKEERDRIREERIKKSDKAFIDLLNGVAFEMKNNNMNEEIA